MTQRQTSSAIWQPGCSGLTPFYVPQPLWCSASRRSLPRSSIRLLAKRRNGVVCWKSMNDAEYRFARSMLVPYLAVPFITTNNFLPITDITVGPTPHPTLESFALGSLLEKHNASEVAFNPSVIPYRTW